MTHMTGFMYTIQMVEQYYRVDPSATWLYGPAQRIYWINVSSNGTNLYPLGSGRIYVVSTITVGGVRYWSEEVPIDYVNEHDYDDNLIAPVIEFSKLNNLVTITPMSPNVITYYSFANDSLHYDQLQEMGWTVKVLWECQLKKNFEGMMDGVISELLSCSTNSSNKKSFYS